MPGHRSNWHELFLRESVSVREYVTTPMRNEWAAETDLILHLEQEDVKASASLFMYLQACRVIGLFCTGFLLVSLVVSGLLRLILFFVAIRRTFLKLKD